MPLPSIVLWGIVLYNYMHYIKPLAKSAAPDQIVSSLIRVYYVKYVHTSTLLLKELSSYSPPPLSINNLDCFSVYRVDFL